MTSLWRGTGGGLLRLPPENTALMRGEECCCEEEEEPCSCCDTGTTPEIVTATISGIVNGTCANCIAFNDLPVETVLQEDPDPSTGYCNWVGYSDWYNMGCPGSPPVLFLLHVVLYLSCYDSPANLIVYAAIEMPGGGEALVLSFTKTATESPPFDCAEFMFGDMGDVNTDPIWTACDGTDATCNLS